MSEEHSTPQATIIPENEHPIREHQLDREALKVLYRLRDAGFKGYLVGGGVRDLFLGKKPKDFDISTDARPGQVRNLFKNSRTIGKRFRLVQVFYRGNKIVEVSTLRSHSEYDEEGEGDFLASNNTFGTLDEDAFRRDLTINALFYEIENHTVIDYVGGVEDLNRGIIRMVGDPGLRFHHDPVRMLRVIRHAARTGFAIDPATFAALGQHTDELMLCPASRLRDEILKDLRSGASRAWAEQCMASPLWATLFPFYGPDATNADKMRTMLLNILSEIDRVHQSSTEEKPVRMDDHFLFAALLLPWVSNTFGLPGEERLHGPAFHELNLALRDGVEEHFGAPFNIQRMAKERLCTLLIHLTTLHHHAGGNGKPPRWLKNKSYYAECRRLYDLYLLGRGEATGGIAVEDFVQPENPEQELMVISTTESASSHSHGRGGGAPIFSSEPGGVFGLRKDRLF